MSSQNIKVDIEIQNVARLDSTMDSGATTCRVGTSKTAVFLCCSRLSETVQEPVKSSDPLETLLL